MLTCHGCGNEYEDGTVFCTHDGLPLKAPTGDLLEGTEVGEYRITGKLGQGAMGSVFAGIHPLIGKKVAVKVLNLDLCRDAGMVQRFVQEARAVNRIAHPNIIDVFSFGTLPDGRHYYVMEMIDGKSLADLLAERRLTTAEARRLLGQLCEGLGAAHAEGIIHRDLKPDNIFIAMPKHGEPFLKILDFGIAKLFSAEEAMTATRTGMPVGTPYYMSPEQIRAQKNIDHRTDIYALGVMMFEIFTGQVPFPRPTVFEVFADHVSTPPPRPSSIHPVSNALDDLILRCLAKNPVERPQTANEVRVALERILAAEAADTLPALAEFAPTAPGFTAVPAPPGARATGPGQSAPPGAPAPGVVSTAAAVEAVVGGPRRSRLGLLVGFGALAVVGVAVVLVVVLKGAGAGPGTPPGPAAATGAVTAPTGARAGTDVGPRRRGVLRVSTDVGVARFFLDGKNVAEGKTATIADVEAGVGHELRAEAEGQPPKILRVLVSEGGESVVEVSFRAGAGTGPAATGPKGGGTARGGGKAAPTKVIPAKAPGTPATKKPLGRDDIAEPD
jgi:eukaryotic-like serine/threonine-protein kinase